MIRLISIQQALSLRGRIHELAVIRSVQFMIDGYRPEEHGYIVVMREGDYQQSVEQSGLKRKFGRLRSDFSSFESNSYKTGLLNAGFIYMLLNIPMFILGYIYLSKRFLAYSSLAMFSLSSFYMLIDFQIDIHNQLYAAVTFGVIIGAGVGMVLRSLGSNGGLDVAGVILYQKFNLGLSKFFFFYNVALFSCSFVILVRLWGVLSCVKIKKAATFPGNDHKTLYL